MSVDTAPRVRSSRTPTNPDCQARRHGNASAKQSNGCRCPEAVADYRRQQNRERSWVGTPPPAVSGPDAVGPPKPAWHDDPRKRCTGVTDPNVFFPDRHNAAVDRQARTLCRACPLRTECLAWALRVDAEHGQLAGIYGGLNPTERRNQLKVYAAFREAAMVREASR